MGALLALQFRLMWRGIPAFLRIAWVFLLVGPFIAFRDEPVKNEALATCMVWPLSMLLIGIASAITSGESLVWFTPIPRSGRTWARLAALASTGAVVTAAILAIPAATHIAIPTPFPQLAMHLWLCWIGGGMLVLFLGDLIQSDTPFVQILTILIGVVLGVALSAWHLTERCPWEVILAEAGGAAVLVALTRYVHADQEIREHHLLPQAWRQPGIRVTEESAAVRAESPNRKLDRIPSTALLLRAGLTSSRPALTLHVLWFLSAALPVLAGQTILGLVSLPLALQSALSYWHPFQTVPLSRSKVFVLLTAPIVTLWIAIMGLNCLSTGIFAETRLTSPGPDGPEWTLPAVKRSRDAEVSHDLRRCPIPKDPDRLAALMSEAYLVSYGLDITPAQIRAVPVPADAVKPSAWIEAVERHYAPLVTRRMLGWHLLAGSALLVLALFSMIGHLPGRWPSWIRWTTLSLGFLVPMMVLCLLSLETNVISNHLPALLRPAYDAIYDRPGTLTILLAGVAAVLYLRHLRVFRSSEMIASPVWK